VVTRGAPRTLRAGRSGIEEFGENLHAIFDVLVHLVAESGGRGSHSSTFRLNLNSVLGLVSKIWHRIPFDQSELSI